MDNEKLIGQARFEKLGNDLFWNLNFYDEDMKWVRLKWVGYDDAPWWDKWSKQNEIKEVNGKTYRIDFRNCNVYEVCG